MVQGGKEGTLCYNFRRKSSQLPLQDETVFFATRSLIRHLGFKCLLRNSENSGESWLSSSDAGKLSFLLYGVKSVSYDVNCAFFFEKYKVL